MQAHLTFATYEAVLTKAYRRHLPHILPAGSTIFLTWRLRGSLPPGFVFDSPDQRPDYVVMPNHVHLLITPKTDVSRITQGLKGATARFANLQLGRTGTSFWQDETFDRFCRSAEEFQRIRGYIARNPVRAGLAKAMGEWPWSSGRRRTTSAPKGTPH